MSLIMISFSLVQFALLAGASQGGKPNPRIHHWNEGYRNLDLDETSTTEVPVTVWTEAERSVNVSSGDLSKIENMFSQINQNLMSQRFQPWNGWGCGSGCGCIGCCGQWPNNRPAHTPENTQNGRQGPSEEAMLEFKKIITELRKKMSSCCKPHGARDIKVLADDIAALITPLAANQKEMQKDSSNLVEAVLQVVEGNQAKMKKQTEEWKAMAAQIQASQEKFRMSMEQQLKKMADENPCPVSPKYKKVGRNIESEKWIVTQRPIHSVKESKRARFDGYNMNIDQ